MEMHLVHANAAGQLAVVAVLIEEGKANKTFEKIISNAPVHEGTVDIDSSINVKKMLPEDTDEFYNFAGSLTTPPYSEGVRWFVMQKTTTFSAHQIEQFAHIVEHNNRPIQDVNARTIYKSDD